MVAIVSESEISTSETFVNAKIIKALKIKLQGRKVTMRRKRFEDVRVYFMLRVFTAKLEYALMLCRMHRCVSASVLQFCPSDWKALSSSSVGDGGCLSLSYDEETIDGFLGGGSF